MENYEHGKRFHPFKQKGRGTDDFFRGMRFFLASDGTDLIIIVENPRYIINKCVEEDMVRNLKYCYEEYSDPILILTRIATNIQAENMMSLKSYIIHG
jgi:hypothetical protein